MQKHEVVSEAKGIGANQPNAMDTRQVPENAFINISIKDLTPGVSDNQVCHLT